MPEPYDEGGFLPTGSPQVNDTGEPVPVVAILDRLQRYMKTNKATKVVPPGSYRIGRVGSTSKTRGQLLHLVPVLDLQDKPVSEDE